MIKNGTYIRSFTDRQREQLELVATEQKLKTAPSVILYVVDQYLEQKKDIVRLNRIIQYKQNKIEKLLNPQSHSYHLQSQKAKNVNKM
ncbi:MAG TPA: hypothetical protein VK528_12000 [Flavobacterium sp.]|nr:hypothetical protein [Flavobacterium sp.]